MRVGRRRFLVASHFNCPSGSISSTLAMVASHFNCPSILNSHHPINKCEYSLFFLPACRHHTTTLYHHSPKCCALLAIFHVPRAGSSLFPPPAYFRRLSMRVAYLFPPFCYCLGYNTPSCIHYKGGINNKRWLHYTQNSGNATSQLGLCYSGASRPFELEMTGTC